MAHSKVIDTLSLTLVPLYNFGKVCNSTRCLSFLICTFELIILVFQSFETLQIIDIMKSLTTLNVPSHVHLSEHHLFSSYHSFDLLTQIHPGQLELVCLSPLLPLVNSPVMMPVFHRAAHGVASWVRTCYSRDLASNSVPAISNLGDPEPVTS